MTTIANTCEVCSSRFPDLDPGWHDRVIGLHEAEADAVMYVALEILQQNDYELPTGQVDVNESGDWNDFLDLHFGADWAEPDSPPIAKFLEELVRATSVPAAPSNDTDKVIEVLKMVNHAQRVIWPSSTTTTEVLRILDYVRAPSHAPQPAPANDIATLTEGMRALLDDMRAQRVEAERQLAERAATS